MADATKQATVEAAPESPTTARPLEMDDDDVQETGILNEDGTPHVPTPAAAATTATDEAPPPKPPRPMTEQQKNVQILKEAFPGVEETVIKAVLSASANRIEPAFNALLEMTDPDAAQHEQPPPQPPRPVQQPIPAGSTPQSQLEADEMYARQLAQHYENVGAYEQRTSNRYGPGAAHQGPSRPRNDMGEQNRSFLDDDLPVIKENLRKGFVETQNRVNSWITNIKKKIDEEFSDDPAHQQQQGGQGAFMGRPSRDGTRRSGDDDRYDADPELLSDDFAGMRFNTDGTPVRDNRANPNVFRPPPPSTSPKPGTERKVAFRDSVDDMDAYSASPKLPPKDTGGAKASKWQPLATIDPSPIAENDPFSLGDSEDEKDHKKPTTAAAAADPKATTDSATSDSDVERLRKAAAEAMADSLVDDKPKGDGKKE